MNKLDVSRRILFGVLVAAGLVSMAMAPLTLGGTISFVHGFWVAAALLLLAIIVSPKAKWTRVLALVVLLCAWMMYRSHRDGLAQLQRLYDKKIQFTEAEIARLKEQPTDPTARPVDGD